MAAMAGQAQAGVTEERVYQIVREAFASHEIQSIVQSWIVPSVGEKFEEINAKVTGAEAEIQKLLSDCRTFLDQNEKKYLDLTTKLDANLLQADAQIQSLHQATSSVPELQQKMDAVGQMTMEAQTTMGQLKADRDAQKAEVQALVAEQQQALKTVAEQVNANRAEASDWSSRMRAEFDRFVAMGSGARPSGPISPGGADAGGKGATVDKKEVAVWKLPDKVDRD